MISKLHNKLLKDPPDAIRKQNRLYRRTEFEFLRKIGDGAYGQVWRVRHKQSNMLFALKQVPKAKVCKMLPQFNREISILYTLNHPHIIKLFTHFEDDKNFYMIMELIEGSTLFRKIYPEKNLSETTAAQYFREIVLAMEYLHSRTPPIVHRDIKPENLLIDSQGRMKLIDFGWANYCESNGYTRKTYCGTSEYMPPEIIEARGHNTSADIWCLGVLLYEILVGNTPFKSTDKEKLAKIITEDPVKFPKNVPLSAQDLISSMLVKDSTRRINIFQVKDHNWLKLNPPVHDPLQQSLQHEKLAVFIKPEHLEKKDHTTAATNSSESEEEPECRFGEVPLRKSLKKLKVNLETESNEIAGNREKIARVVRMIGVEEEKCAAVEEMIGEKRKEISKIAHVSKELLSKVFDANLELEILQGEDINELAEKNRESQKRLLELTKECKFYNLNLQNLRKNVNKESVSIANSEIQLNRLQSSLEQLRKMTRHIKSGSKSSENEMKLSIEMLNKQLLEKTIVLSTFSTEDLLAAKDVSGCIKLSMAGIGSLSRDIQKKIESAEEKSNDLEQAIEELKISGEKEKFCILQKFSSTKDCILGRIKQERKFLRNLQKKADEEGRKCLQEKINVAFALNFPIQHTDFEKANDRIHVIFPQVLKNMITRLQKIETRKRADHMSMKNAIVSNTRILECKL